MTEKGQGTLSTTKKEDNPIRETNNEIRLPSNPNNNSLDYPSSSVKPAILIRKVVRQLEDQLYRCGDDSARQFVENFEVALNRLNNRLKDRANASSK